MPVKPSRAWAKGAAFVKLVADYLREVHDYEVMVRAKGEEGDDMLVAQLAHISFEMKCHDAMDLAGWMKQAKDQAGEKRFPVVVHKRRARSAAEDQWVTMELGTFIRLVERGASTKL